MDIVIISHFCRDFSKTDNGRFTYLAKMLVDRGNDVEIITSSFHHAKKRQRQNLSVQMPFRVTFLHEPGYRKNVCLKRFWSHFVWGRRVKEYLQGRKKPDTIYCAIPSLTGSYYAARYCISHGVRFVIDVQDLWPEAFEMVFDVPVISNLIFAPFKRRANFVYGNADTICAVSDTYGLRAQSVNGKCRGYTTVFLGTDLKEFDHYTGQTQDIKKGQGEIWLAYCGTLGASYDLTCVIDAIAMLQDIDIRFIVMGDGPRRDEFQSYADNKGINSSFMGMLRYDQMCSILKICDIAVNPIMHNAAQSIINKHADYAAAGIPVLNTQECEEYQNLVDEYQMGFNCRNSDARDLAEKIKVLAENPVLRVQMGQNARKCAEERFDKSRNYQKLVDVILKG